MMKVAALLIFVLVLCMIKLILFLYKSEIKLNASLILYGGYDEDKTHTFLFMLSILNGLKMIYFCSQKLL
jgi:hypothetical protein